MKITCPQCEFSRDVAEEKMPSGTFMATCPHCQHRFKIERTQTVATVESEHAQANSSPSQKTQATPSPVVASSPVSQEASAQKNEQASMAEQPVQAYQHTSEKETKQEPVYEEHTLPEYSTENPQDSEPDFGIDNPWDSPAKYGYFSAFYQTAMRILFAAPRFFFGLSAQTPILSALLFFCILTVYQITFERFWGGVIASSLAPMSANDPLLQLAVEFLTPKMAYLMHILLGTAINVMKLLFCVFIFTMLFHFIAPKKGGFPLIFQIVAYSSAPILLSAVPVIGSLVGFVWSIATTLIGCRYAMRLDWSRTLLGVLPAYLLGLYIALQFVAAWWGFLDKVA